MDRRSFMKTAGLAAGSAAAVSGIAAPAIAQGAMELKMVTTWPKNLPGLGVGAQRLADRIGTLTEGRITVKVFAAGELVPPFESFDAVSTGTADLYHAADYYFQGKHKALNFFTTVPMGLTAAELNAWINYMGGQDLWDELSGQFNIKAFQVGNTGAQMGGWFKNELKSLEDLKGLNFRMPGLGGEVLRRLGVNVQSLPGGEIFTALQSGAIDGTDWVGPWSDLAFGFYKILKNYYYPSMFEPGAAISLGVNRGVWDKLSDSDKELFRVVSMAENNQMYSDFKANDGQALETLVSEHGVKLHEFPEDILMALGKTSDEVVAEVGQEDALSKKIYESFLSARKLTGRSSSTTEKAFLIARDRVLAG
ncbi:TRAP transporter substrate-binding protein [Kaustia mangrovi]|uniref:TRAP transporter substrate-binding protein n=1 Tax=Kaustia mangrovi TaxID=2593653 RepID=A0A7S8HB46_9HYPH|nr:TRAP transporter substrate-binding protein [Kaustia mangrovi]QPC42225.1 TRAP transporter substrate-binding protein [Kaustia mangrovi]